LKTGGEAQLDSVSEKDKAWEGEGGGAIASLSVRTISISRKPNQVERAKRMKRQMNDE
jgi:hypothetical protein